MNVADCDWPAISAHLDAHGWATIPNLLTHEALLVEVWGPAYADDTQTLRTHIANLRRKIEPQGDGPRYIRTDPGIGYRFAA